MIQPYQPQDKDIFTYEVPDVEGNMCTLRADPSRIRRLMQLATRGEADNWYDKAATLEGDEKGQNAQTILVDRMQAIGELSRAASAAFNLPAFNPDTGTGYTEDFLYSLALSFDDWCQKKRESMSLPATLPLGTEATSSPSPTNSSSECG